MWYPATYIVFAGVGLLFLASITSRLYTVFWRIRFEKIFGFAPEKTWTGRLIQKVQVDRQLSCYASRLDQWIEEENTLLNPYFQKKANICSSSSKDLEQWKRIRISLELAKSDFWTAHKAARLAGFSVKEKYSKYLK